MTAHNYEYTYPVPLAGGREAVFSALTEPGALTAWFAEFVEIDLRVGGAFRFWGRHTYGTPGPGDATQRVTALDAPERVAFSWRILDRDSTVCWSILEERERRRNRYADPGDSRFRRVCRRLAGPRSLIDDLWRIHTGNLSSYLKGRSDAYRPDFSNPNPEVRCEITVDAPPEKVFAALITPQYIKQWFPAPAPVVEPHVGGKYGFGFSFEHEGATIEPAPMTILAYEPDRKLSITWPDWRGSPGGARPDGHLAARARGWRHARDTRSRRFYALRSTCRITRSAGRSFSASSERSPPASEVRKEMARSGVGAHTIDRCPMRSRMSTTASPKTMRRAVCPKNARWAVFVSAWSTGRWRSRCRAWSPVSRLVAPSASRDGIAAFVLGGLLLAVLGSVTGLVGQSNRLTSCMTISFVFGRHGAVFVNLLIALSLLGWYGVNMDMLSAVLRELAERWLGVSPKIAILEVVGGVLMTLTTVLGFRLLERLASLLVPVMIVVVAYMAYRVTESLPADFSAPAAGALSFGEAVSVVVGSFVVGAVLMPDFTRFAAHRRDAVVASVIPFLVLCTLVYVVAAAAGLAVDQTDVLTVLLALGTGSMAFFLIGASAWLTNAVNLYNAALGINAVFRRVAEWKIVLVAGALGTVAASFNLLDRFTEFLFGLAIVFAPVAGVYIADFFVIRRRRIYDIGALATVSAYRYTAFGAWLAGIGASVLANNGVIAFSGIEAIDATFAAMLSYILLERVRERTAPHEVRT